MFQMDILNKAYLRRKGVVVVVSAPRTIFCNLLARSASQGWKNIRRKINYLAGNRFALYW